MRDRERKGTVGRHSLLVPFRTIMLIAAVTNAASAKSLYVIADIQGSATDRTQPVHAYDIGVNGTLAFQAQHDIPHRMLGAVGMAIDSDSGYLFITYEASGEIQLVDGTTMTGVGRVEAADAVDLAGIVYDHAKKLLYCVDRGRKKLYVYNWDAKTTSLTRVSGSPVTLWGDVSTYGIALDEIDGLLYVASANKTVNVYSTSDWSQVRQIELGRAAISVAVDVMNGFLYTGGGYAGNNYLTQYHLATGVETEVQAEPDAGVMGLGVDPDTGLVYMSTGVNNAPGGDNLLVYDTELNQIDEIHVGGNPTGLAIPGKDISFNPLNLTKKLIRGAVGDAAPGEIPSAGAGKTITYGIGFGNLSNEFTVTDVSVVDALSHNVTFVSADDDGVGGNYDSKTHTYTWFYSSLPPGSSALLELTVQVGSDIETGTIISNYATINSNETRPTTKREFVVVKNEPFNLIMGILGSLEGQAAKVSPDEMVTYTICFDNNYNDFAATNVIVTDALPSEMDFVSADNGEANGLYDPKTHTYTWWHPDLSPGKAVCLELTGRVNPDLMPGTVITNRVTIKSNEMPESIASVDALAQSDSELIITGTVHYGGTHTGLVHIAAADMNDLLAYEDQADVHDLGLAAHITIPEPGPYSLTIPHAPVGHSYVIVAQMDIDNSGLFSIESFQQYEPSGHYNGCAWGGCNASGAVPGELLPALDVEIYLSDYEPSCILLDTFDADYLSPPATSMDYYNGYLWICQYHNGIDIYQVNPNTGALVNTYDLGNGRCAGLEWIGDDLWTCFQGPTSWTIRQYTYDGQAFTSVVSYPLPMDWNVVRNASIAWNGTLLWAQEEGHCGHIYKLDLSSGALLDTISECAFTYNKWLGFSDMEDICFSDGYLWAMNDSAATFAKIAPDPNQLPPDMHYTFAFDPNSHILDHGHSVDTASYGGMVKHGDLIYFIEHMKIREANNTIIERKYRIHTARL